MSFFVALLVLFVFLIFRSMVVHDPHHHLAPYFCRPYQLSFKNRLLYLLWKAKKTFEVNKWAVSLLLIFFTAIQLYVLFFIVDGIIQQRVLSFTIVALSYQFVSCLCCSLIVSKMTKIGISSISLIKSTLKFFLCCSPLLIYLTALAFYDGFMEKSYRNTLDLTVLVLVNVLAQKMFFQRHLFSVVMELNFYLLPVFFVVHSLRTPESISFQFFAPALLILTPLFFLILQSFLKKFYWFQRKPYR